MPCAVAYHHVKRQMMSPFAASKPQCSCASFRVPCNESTWKEPKRLLAAHGVIAKILFLVRDQLPAAARLAQRIRKELAFTVLQLRFLEDCACGTHAGFHMDSQTSRLP